MPAVKPAMTKQMVRMVLTRMPLAPVAVLLRGDPGDDPQLADRLAAAIGPSPRMAAVSTMDEVGHRPHVRVGTPRGGALTITGTDDRLLRSQVGADGCGSRLL